MTQAHNALVTAECCIRPTYSYVLCGWQTRSDIPITNVPVSVCDTGAEDIRIQIAIGASPIAGKNSGRVLFDHAADRSFIRVRGVADFVVTQGKQIQVWPATGAANKDVEVILFGPVWATLCHQRGILPLHASAIVTGEGITAFAGHSGAGKSTTAASLVSLDHALVTDDVLPVSFNANLEPGAWPYLRRFKLQNDSIARLKLSSCERVSEKLDKGKYLVPAKWAAEDKWKKLERVYLLEVDEGLSRFSIERISGAEAVQTLIDHTYHFAYIQGTRTFRPHLTFCAEAASKIAIYRMRRPGGFSPDVELRSIIQDHIATSRS